jgi:SAM-dependent methyltransferase
MAVPFEALECSGVLKVSIPAAPYSLLDIGRSNVYDAEPRRLTTWIEQHSASASESWVADFAARSGFDEAGNRRNTAFLGELCANIGVDYCALDIMEAPSVLLFDLNLNTLPEPFFERFDLVLNSGTTEHVLNQLNAFKAIHDATKPGGEMLHILPLAGHTDHGYVHYTSRFFFDLAGYNDYEILEAEYFWSEGTVSKLFDAVRSYAVHFPVLRQTESRGLVVGASRFGPEPALADIGIVVRYQKKRSSRFAAALDTATTVAAPPPDVLGFYDRHNPRAEMSRAIDKPGGTDKAGSRFLDSAAAYEVLTDQERAGLERLVGGQATLEEALLFYNSVVARLGVFPLDWELPIVELSLQREPGRPDLLHRMAVLRSEIAAMPKTALSSSTTPVGAAGSRSGRLRLVSGAARLRQRISRVGRQQ